MLHNPRDPVLFTGVETQNFCTPWRDLDPHLICDSLDPLESTLHSSHCCRAYGCDQQKYIHVTSLAIGCVCDSVCDVAKKTTSKHVCHLRLYLCLCMIFMVYFVTGTVMQWSQHHMHSQTTSWTSLSVLFVTGDKWRKRSCDSFRSSLKYVNQIQKSYICQNLAFIVTGCKGMRLVWNVSCLLMADSV